MTGDSHSHAVVNGYAVGIEVILTYEEYNNTKYFPALDSMRAVSILLVLTEHMGDNNRQNVWRFLSGYSGVTVFFVLSGYLITMLSLREEEKNGSISILAFYVRRLCRIFPLYFFTLGLLSLLVFSVGPLDMRNRLTAAMPYYLTWLNEFAPAAAFGQSWSLGIEEKFYIIWPVFGFVLLRRFSAHRLFVSVTVLMILECLHISGTVPMMAHYRSIMIGCVIAICLHRRDIFIRANMIGKPLFTYCALLVFIVVQLALKPYQQEVIWIYPYIVGVMLTSLVLADNSFAPWLKCRALTLTGERSYGIYLIHFLCIDAAEKVFHPGTGNLLVSVLALLLTSAISLGFAEVLFRLIEKPMSNIGRRVSNNIFTARGNITAITPKVN